jgi:IS5 family transposase
MFKILILQRWYGLSDLEVERQMADRISFMAFLGFPNQFPDPAQYGFIQATHGGN